MKLDRNKRSYIADISSTLVGFYCMATNQAKMEVFFLKIFIVLWGIRCACACVRAHAQQPTVLATGAAPSSPPFLAPFQGDFHG